MTKLVVPSLLLLTFMVGLGVFLIVRDSTTDQEDQGRDIIPDSLLEQVNGDIYPYTLEAMRARKYNGGELRAETEVGTFSKFRSQIVSYTSDGLRLYALMNTPTSAKPQSGFPVVIVNHGYINPESYSTTNSYKTIADYYANNGYVVLKPDYRGHGQSESGGSSSLNRINYAVDVLNLISLIPTISEADPSSVYMYGHSMGGDVALRVLEISTHIKATSLWAPVSADFPESLLYFVRKNRPEKYEEILRELTSRLSTDDYPKISTLANLGFIKGAVMIHHGTSDESVPYAWSVELDKKLTEVGVNHDFYTYPGENHNFTQGAWSTLAKRDLTFFQKF